MNCRQSGCGNEAFYRYTWPGKDESVICTEHVNSLKGIADAIGLHLQVRPIADLPNGNDSGGDT